jgi:excisionase family DNA binding protein
LDRLLTVEEAADRLGTSVRFVRRLILERRIAYTKLGRHVCILEADLVAYVTQAPTIRAVGGGPRQAVPPPLGSC